MHKHSTYNTYIKSRQVNSQLCTQLIFYNITYWNSSTGTCMARKQHTQYPYFHWTLYVILLPLQVSLDTYTDLTACYLDMLHRSTQNGAAHIGKLGDVSAGTHLLCCSLVFLPVLLKLLIHCLQRNQSTWHWSGWRSGTCGNNGQMSSLNRTHSISKATCHLQPHVACSHLRAHNDLQHYITSVHRALGLTFRVLNDFANFLTGSTVISSVWPRKAS